MAAALIGGAAVIIAGIFTFAAALAGGRSTTFVTSLAALNNELQDQHTTDRTQHADDQTTIADLRHALHVCQAENERLRTGHA